MCLGCLIILEFCGSLALWKALPAWKRIRKGESHPLSRIEVPLLFPSTHTLSSTSLSLNPNVVYIWIQTQPISNPVILWFKSIFFSFLQDSPLPPSLDRKAVLPSIPKPFCTHAVLIPLAVSCCSFPGPFLPSVPGSKGYIFAGLIHLFCFRILSHVFIVSQTQSFQGKDCLSFLPLLAALMNTWASGNIACNISFSQEHGNEK